MRDMALPLERSVVTYRLAMPSMPTASTMSATMTSTMLKPASARLCASLVTTTQSSRMRFHRGQLRCDADRGADLGVSFGHAGSAGGFDEEGPAVELVPT